MIELKNVSKTYKMGEIEVRALRDINLTISRGEFVVIMGSSGSGKSTLMHLIGLLDTPDKGEYYLDGKLVSGLGGSDLAALRNKKIGFVFQQFFLLPRMTALENAHLPLIYAGKKHIQEITKEKLSLVGLRDRMTHRPNELSGGQQQRVAIARALVNDPDIILADEPTGNLDSASKAEIMALLKELNRQGKTVVIVTHEREIAEEAKRLITIRDGAIISDTSGSRKEDVSRGEPSTGPDHKIRQKGMEFVDYVRQAFSAMFAHKVRSFLSILGILIGVAAIIAMLALGRGAQASIEAQLASLGANLLVIRPGSARVHGVSMETGTVARFTFQDLAAIAKLKNSVSKATPSVTGRGQVVYANKNWNTRIEGTGPEYEEMRASVPVLGRFFTEEETKRREKVALIGATVAKELFGDEDPIGGTIKINLINFKVIGILPVKGATGFHDQDDTILVPVTTAMYRLFGKDYLDSIYVEAKSADLIEDAQNEIKDVIKKRHSLSDKEAEDAFQIRNMADIKATMEATTKTMGLLLGSIAAISLLVGGIGIMNIMLVSVTERTREIGLRKAIGATHQDILIQFLFESVLMTFIGGLLGVLIGAGISGAIVLITKWSLKISAYSIILSTAFSFIVGVVFGLWPAYQASRLNPIDALRYE